ncbi:MAG: cold shock domain-containing protein [Spirochaetia bacterium]|nr:cold shock domain-containing protein [Spirochaetia bacterium]
MSEASEVIDYLNKNFQIYSEKFSKQFHLKIPKNTLNTIQFYRETYFPYIKNSIYKSNICYLMQLLDYQIWLYKVFKPSLSLENAYFYQLLMTMGIISEALSTAILLNPLVEEDEKDTSLGVISEEHNLLQEYIVKNNFQNNIKLISKFNILPKPVIAKFTAIRIEMRNLIHIQNWQGRLYQQLGIEKFSDYLEKFRDFLSMVKGDIKINISTEMLSLEFFQVSAFKSGELFTGIIHQFHPEKGFGFIQSESFQRKIYFHRANCVDNTKMNWMAGNKVLFRLILGKKGIEASIQAQS